MATHQAPSTEPAVVLTTAEAPPTEAKAATGAAKARGKQTAKTAAKTPARRVAAPVAKAPATAASAAAAPARKSEKKIQADKSVKPKKAKLVRDSFTMPEPEYALLAAVKKRCIAKGVAAKKSEVLRAAVISLAAKSDSAIMASLKALTVIKTGRPPKGKK